MNDNLDTLVKNTAKKTTVKKNPKEKKPKPLPPKIADSLTRFYLSTLFQKPKSEMALQFVKNQQYKKDNLNILLKEHRLEHFRNKYNVDKIWKKAIK
mgnify:CR=1 FL=1